MEKRKGRNGGTINVWQPGQSGNPKGAKPGYVQAKTALKRLLAAKGKFMNPLTGKEELMDVSDALHLMQLKKAIETSDTSAYKEVMDRVEGKATQRTELTGEDGDPIKIEQTAKVVLQIQYRKPIDDKTKSEP